MSASIPSPASIDPAHHFLGLRLNFFVACLLTLAGAAWFAQTQGRLNHRRRLARGGALLLAGGTPALAGCGEGSTARASAFRAPEGKPQRLAQLLAPVSSSGSKGRVPELTAMIAS